MPKPNPLAVQSSDIVGLKYFDMHLPLLKRIHNNETKRDVAKNRELHYDQYCLPRSRRRLAQHHDSLILH